MSRHFGGLCSEFSSDPGKCRLAGAGVCRGWLSWALGTRFNFGNPSKSRRKRCDIVPSLMGLTPFLTPTRGFALNAEGRVITCQEIRVFGSGMGRLLSSPQVLKSILNTDLQL